MHEPILKNERPTLEIYDNQWSNFKSHEPTVGSSFNLWSVMKNHLKKIGQSWFTLNVIRPPRTKTNNTQNTHHPAKKPTDHLFKKNPLKNPLIEPHQIPSFSHQQINARRPSNLPHSHSPRSHNMSSAKNACSLIPHVNIQHTLHVRLEISPSNGPHRGGGERGENL
jgi:hypothetical protein